MDTLHAYILILHAKVQRDRLRERILFLEKAKPMTPKLAGIRQQLALLQSDVDTESQNLLNKIDGARAKTKVVFAGTNDKVDRAMKGMGDQVAEINDFLDGLAQSNGGPTLAGSEPASPPQTPQVETPPPAGNGQDPQPQPQASWPADKPQG